MVRTDSQQKKSGGGGMTVCPKCGQSIQDLRCGVRLPRNKVRIFDAIRASGEIGITSEGVIRVAYDGEEKPDVTAIKAHVSQINDLIENANVRIVAQREGRESFWVLIKKRR